METQKYYKNNKMQIQFRSEYFYIYCPSCVQGFSKLCYNLVQFGTIKMSAYLGSGGDTIHFPALDITLDRSR